MSTYQKSAVAKAKILQAAMELYWEKGYNATRNIDIAARADIPTGLIAYYFPHKKNLAEAAYQIICIRFHEKVTAAVGNREDSHLLFASAVRVGWYYSANCEEFRRFYQEIAQERVQMMPFSEKTNFLRVDAMWMELFVNSCDIPDDDEDFYINCRLAAAIELELMATYIDWRQEISIENLIRRATVAEMELMNIPRDEIMRCFEEAKAICERHTFEMTEYFEMR